MGISINKILGSNEAARRKNNQKKEKGSRLGILKS
jgi:hypothetical protein